MGPAREATIFTAVCVGVVAIVTGVVLLCSALPWLSWPCLGVGITAGLWVSAYWIAKDGWH